ncbi:Alpha/Beta hydrolase protein [Ilyonectria destructans]|nr:Alpha/Beta hydrolase protein [Ilyonectria destructans]
MDYSVPTSAVPFTLHVADDECSQLKQLLQLSRVMPTTWENQHEGRRYGVTHKWLVSTKEYWLETFNWRAQESYINSFPNYRMLVNDLKGDVTMHFVALFSKNRQAIPIVLLHGWPGSFLEFLPMLDLVRKKHTPGTQPYHFIVPSLPGYTLSSSVPENRPWLAEDTARAIDQTVRNLGFDRYIVQGGDVGSLIATMMGTNHDSVAGVHLNLLPTLDDTSPDDPMLNDTEKEAVQSSIKRSSVTAGAAQLQIKKCSTVAAVVSSNPIALLAWIGEKLLDWTEEDPSLDDILTNVSLYWFTNCFAHCIYTYRDEWYDSLQNLATKNKPFGYSWFMYELVPGPRHIVEHRGKLIFYRQHLTV